MRVFEHAWSLRVGWFRLFGVGLAWTNHIDTPPLFTERYAGQHGIPARVYLHVGPWCLCVTTRRRI